MLSLSELLRLNYSRTTLIYADRKILIICVGTGSWMMLGTWLIRTFEQMKTCPCWESIHVKAGWLPPDGATASWCPQSLSYVHWHCHQMIFLNITCFSDYTHCHRLESKPLQGSHQSGSNPTSRLTVHCSFTQTVSCQIDRYYCYHPLNMLCSSPASGMRTCHLSFGATHRLPLVLQGFRSALPSQESSCPWQSTSEPPKDSRSAPNPAANHVCHFLGCCLI